MDFNSSILPLVFALIVSYILSNAPSAFDTALYKLSYPSPKPFNNWFKAVNWVFPPSCAAIISLCSSVQFAIAIFISCNTVVNPLNFPVLSYVCTPNFLSAPSVVDVVPIKFTNIELRALPASDPFVPWSAILPNNVADSSIGTFIFARVPPQAIYASISWVAVVLDLFCALVNTFK